MKSPTLSGAINYCEVMGYGWDVSYPQHKWHVKKNYADNFKWKGKAPEENEYD